MNERIVRLCENLKNCFVWDKLVAAFNEQGKGLTEEDIELYVYVIDVQGPTDLAGINKQYSILEEITHNNFSNYEELYDNVEAFLKKMIYVIDPHKYEMYIKSENRGIAAILKFLEIIDDDYFDKTKTKTSLYRIFSNIIYERNSNTHSAPVTSPDKIAEIVWKSIFIELWAVRKNKSELEEVKNRLSEDIYQKIVEDYRQHQVYMYEQRLESGLKYIQIEYEKAQDPEADNEEEIVDVIKGTADTLMESINFNETPSIKLIAEAGMGKTMMLEYINYKLSKDMYDINEIIIPIFICCNDTKGDLKNYLFKDTVLNKLRSFLVSKEYANVSEKGLLEYILKNYRIMFLVDGLNEINKSNIEKSKFIKSLTDYIKSDREKKCYFLITERYSRGATTIKNNVVYYRLSEVTENIKRQFFSAKGADTLFNRLEVIKYNYDAETQRELNLLLKRPFYLSVFCEMADSFSGMEDNKLPKNKQELMDFFVRELIKRENAKGEIAANYMYVRLYLVKLAELSSLDNRILLVDVLKGFAEVTQEYGLNNQEYSSNHILELFEQLGFIKCSDDMCISIEDIYAEYMEELLLELL